MSGKVTLSLNAPALMELIESNPEVELEVAKGTIANVADRIAKKELDCTRCWRNHATPTQIRERWEKMKGGQ